MNKLCVSFNVIFMGNKLKITLKYNTNNPLLLLRVYDWVSVYPFRQELFSGFPVTTTLLSFQKNKIDTFFLSTHINPGTKTGKQRWMYDPNDYLFDKTTKETLSQKMYNSCILLYLKFIDPKGITHSLTYYFLLIVSI